MISNLNKTRRFPRSTTNDGRATTRGEPVVPNPSAGTNFVGAKSGKRHERAYIVFVGEFIDAAEVIRRSSGKLPDSPDILGLIDAFIGKVSVIPLGTVIELTENDGVQVQIRIVDSFPKREPGPNLP